MLNNSVEEIAIESLFLTLRDSLPALVAARNNFRAASVRLPLGPYMGGGALKVNGVSVQLPGGSLDARDVAPLLNANVSSVLASEEIDGNRDRLVITSRNAPTEEATSFVSVSGSLGTFESVSSFLASPKLYASELGRHVRIDSPVVFLSDAPIVTRDRNLRSGLFSVSLFLEIMAPGSVNMDPAVARERAREIEFCIQKAIEIGDSRGPYFVGGSTVGASVFQAVLPRLSVSPKSYELVQGASTIPVGVCNMEIQIRISKNGV